MTTPAYSLSGDKLTTDLLGQQVSPVLAAIARNHVPAACHADYLAFIQTGCATEQLLMLIRYMGGTPPPLAHIEIEERKGVLHASAQFPGGINWTGRGVIVPARLPETARLSLVGRPLSALLDHPLLPGDAVISEVRTMMSNMLIADVTADADTPPPNPTF